MLALIDMDCLVYKAAFGAQRTCYEITINDLHSNTTEVIDLLEGTSKEAAEAKVEELKAAYPHARVEMTKYIQALSEQLALSGVKNMIYEILEDLGAKKFKGYLTATDDHTNFRKHVATIKPYKGNRKDFTRPVHYEAVRNYLQTYWRAEVVHGIEADDALAMEHTKHSYWEDDETFVSNSILVTIDKDMQQVPGFNYNFDKKELKLIYPLEGLRALYAQTLTGDNADNIPGLHRVGPKTATKLLAKASTEEEMEAICINEYKKHKLTEKEFKEVFRLVKLITDQDELEAIKNENKQR